ncbi:MAG: lactate utilization protein [Gemmatimonadales bacterium]|nr:lactate utilization protein [Gemmatimonadales bacterium]
MSRDRILADVRAALLRVMPPPHHHPHPAWPVAAPGSWSSLLAQFRERFEGLGGQWHPAGDRAAVDAQLVAIARQYAGAVWVARDPDGLLDRLGVADTLVAAGVEVVRGFEGPEHADRLGLSITATTAAIAESGTFALIPSPGQGRLSSVIAPAHLTVLDPARVVATLGDFIRQAASALGSRQASAAVLVTGPSRTADIEGQLLVGVHGPGRVHCLPVGGA